MVKARYLGEWYECVYGEERRAVTVEPERIILSPPWRTVEALTKTWERWLVKQAADSLLPLLRQTAKEMDIEVPAARLREARSRWGSCSSHGAIMLNWRLVQAPVVVQRYVIVHELVHRVHFDHSHAFWAMVAKYDPEVPLHKGWLRRHGRECVTPDFSPLLADND